MMMKNTKTPQSKSYKSETLGREILKKINRIGEKTYRLKKDVNGIWFSPQQTWGNHVCGGA